MKYTKSISYTFINESNTKVQLVNDGVYEVIYEQVKDDPKYIKGRIICIDDGEGDFSVFNRPSITLDCSYEFNSVKIDIPLDCINSIYNYGC